MGCQGKSAGKRPAGGGTLRGRSTPGDVAPDEFVELDADVDGQRILFCEQPLGDGFRVKASDRVEVDGAWEGGVPAHRVPGEFVVGAVGQHELQLVGSAKVGEKGQVVVV